jgi:curved DNA-binding protein CbpA
MAELLRAVPRTRPGIDLRGVDLTAEQAFVYSRLDGRSTVAEVCAVSGLGEAATIGALRRLVSLGLVSVDGLEPEPARRSTPPPSPPTSPEDVGVDIEPDRRARIRRVHESLATLHFYDLLGISPRADRKEIRDAYFRFSKEFHPDSYFGRKLGAYREKLEAIFRRLTEAYGVLTHKDKRAEYDLYIADQLAAAEMEERLREADKDAARIAEELARAKAEAALPKRDPAEAEALRREALRQKLGGGRKVVPSSSTTPAIASARDAIRDPKAVSESLRRAVGAGQIDDERKEKARQCAETARRAMASEDWINAVNAFNLAVTLDPSDAGYRAERDESSKKARAALAVTYARQGRFEEGLGHFEEACRNWLKAAEGQPQNPAYLERAAAMLVATRGDLHRAQDLARTAVELKPDDPALRVTLAAVYEAAGLPRNAKREIDVALRLDPDHAGAHAMLKRIRRLL